MTRFYAKWEYNFEGLQYGHYTGPLAEWYCREMCANTIDPLDLLFSKAAPYGGVSGTQIAAQMHLIQILLQSYPMRMSVDVYFEPGHWATIQRSPELLQRIFNTFTALYSVEITQDVCNEYAEVFSQRKSPLIGYRISGDERVYPCFYWVQLLVRHLSHCRYPGDTTLERLIQDAADYDDDMYPDNDSEDQLEAWELLQNGKEMSALRMMAHSYGPKAALSDEEAYWERHKDRAVRDYSTIMSITTPEQVIALLEKAHA